MTHLTSVVLISLTVLLNGCMTSSSKANLYFIVRTEPSNPTIIDLRTGERHFAVINRVLTREELDTGKVILGPFELRRAGHIPQRIPEDSVIIPSDVLDLLRRGGRDFDHAYPRFIKLEKDPDYWGSNERRNRVEITINSEPRGARIYEDGAFRGSTPLRLEFAIEKKHYQQGVFRSKQIIAAHDECLPEGQILELEVDPSWRYQEDRTVCVTSLL